MEKKTKFQEIVNRVKDTLPKDAWAETIKTRIKAAKPYVPKPEPDNDGINIDDFTRATADKLCNVHFDRDKEDPKILVTQFMRGKDKPLGASICFKSKQVVEKFEKGNILGALVAFKHDDKVLLGWSMYNKNHEVLPFSKKNAIRVAILRGLSDNVLVNARSIGLSGKWIAGSGVEIPTQISTGFATFAERARKYFNKPIDNLKHVAGE